MSALIIERAAPIMQLQDLGRFGVAHHGLSQGGPMDLHAHCWANRLLGNPVSCATIEITFGNTEFSTQKDTWLALCGADMHATIEGKPVPTWSSFLLKNNQSLKLSYTCAGMHSYLAATGGFDSSRILESQSTVLRNDIGNLLNPDDQVRIHGSQFDGPATYTPPCYIPDYSDQIELRMISYGEETPEVFQTQFSVSQRSNRMGSILETKSPLSPKSGIISEALPIGTVQLPPDGKPIILLNDRQTQGGYYKLGSIMRCDLPKIAQAPPGTRVSIRQVDLESARKEWLEFCHFFRLLGRKKSQGVMVCHDSL